MHYVKTQGIYQNNSYSVKRMDIYLRRTSTAASMGINLNEICILSKGWIYFFKQDAFCDRSGHYLNEKCELFLNGHSLYGSMHFVLKMVYSSLWNMNYGTRMAIHLIWNMHSVKWINNHYKYIHNGYSSTVPKCYCQLHGIISG